MTISLETNDTHTVITIPGNFDTHIAFKVRELFSELIKHADRNVILDLSKTQHLDSSGIGAIVFLFKRLHVLSYSLELRDLQEQPFHLIEQLRINKIITVSKQSH